MRIFSLLFIILVSCSAPPYPTDPSQCRTDCRFQQNDDGSVVITEEGTYIPDPNSLTRDEFADLEQGETVTRVTYEDENQRITQSTVVTKRETDGGYEIDLKKETVINKKGNGPPEVEVPPPGGYETETVFFAEAEDEPEDSGPAPNRPSRGSTLGDQLGKGVKKIVDLAGDLYDELSGKNKKKREKAKKEIEQKVKDALDLAEQADRLAASSNLDINESLDLADQIGSSDYSSPDDVRNTSQGHGKNHNDFMNHGFDDLDPYATNLDLPEIPEPPGYPEFPRIASARDYADTVEGMVESDPSHPEYRERLTAVDVARGMIDHAEDNFKSGQVEEGDQGVSMALEVLDVVAGFTPGVGLATDIWKAATGKNPITGETLSDTERALAVAGAATLGFGSVLTKGYKAAKLGVKILDKAMRRSDKAQDLARLDKASDTAEEVLESATKAGIPGDKIGDTVKAVDDVLKKNPCTASLTPPGSVIDKILGLVVGTAYAAGPCNIGVDDVFEAASKKAGDFEASIAKLPPGERVAKVKGVATVKAAKNNWKKNNGLKTKNGGRDIYTDSKGTHWGVDTQHGHWEKFNKKTGKHEGAYNMDGEFLDGSVVPGRKINL